MTLPWLPEQQDMETLARFKRAGVTFISATAEDFPPTFEGVVRCIQRFNEVAEAEQSWLRIDSSLAGIDQGRHEGKLVVGLQCAGHGSAGHGLVAGPGAAWPWRKAHAARLQHPQFSRGRLRRGVRCRSEQLQDGG